MSLALDVSTKCGIDPQGVRVAWGIACIKVGDYNGARDKLAKCLKVRVLYIHINIQKFRYCLTAIQLKVMIFGCDVSILLYYSKMLPTPFQVPKDKNSAVQSPKQLSDILNALDKAPTPNPTMVCQYSLLKFFSALKPKFKVFSRSKLGYITSILENQIFLTVF